MGRERREGRGKWGDERRERRVGRGDGGRPNVTGEMALNSFTPVLRQPKRFSAATRASGHGRLRVVHSAVKATL